MEKEKRTEISELGKFGLIERLTGKIDGEAMVIDNTLISSKMLLEGIDFDLTYFPLYK